MASHRATRRRLRILGLSVVVAAGVVLMQSFVLNAHAETNTARLDSGESLTAGERLTSPDGRYVVTMQDDGNLVEYAPGNRSVWATATSVPGSEARMQTDGNFVVIAPGNAPAWSTRTDGNPGATLELQNDGNLVVYAQGHVSRWSSGVPGQDAPTGDDDTSNADAAPPVGTSTIPTVQVTRGGDGGSGSAGQAFHMVKASIFMNSRSNPYLSGFATADGPFRVTGALEMQVCGATSQMCTTPFRKDFTKGCTTGPQPTPPAFLGKYLNPGLNTVIFILRNVCGGPQANTDIFLSGYGVIDPTIKPPNECKGNATKWLGGLIGEPFYTSQPALPNVGADHMIHGTGTVDVRSKVNCSSRVQISLQTRVCNRLGANCNPRTIAETSVDGLPDTGLYLKNLSGSCRTGKDDYRVQIHVSYTTFDGLDGIADGQAAGIPFPVFTPHDDYAPDGDKGWTSLTC